MMRIRNMVLRFDRVSLVQGSTMPSYFRIIPISLYAIFFK
jgi:hypothetical protein